MKISVEISESDYYILLASLHSLEDKLSRENTCPVESTSPVGPKEGEGLLHQLTFFSISGDIINRSKVALEPQAAHTSGHVRSLTRFRSMKQLGTLLLSPGWDASPSQGYPPAVC